MKEGIFMKTKRILTLSVALLAMSGLTACDTTTETSSSSSTSQTNTSVSSSANQDTSATKAQLVQAWIDFTYSKQGLAIISQNGGILPSNALTQATSFNANDYAWFKADNSSLTINIAGSTSVEKITDALAETFTSYFSSGKSCKFDTTHQTGSGTAVAGVEDGSADVGYLSRELDSDELTTVTQIGANHSHFAIDAVVPIVNSSNQLANITTEELARIYAGEHYYQEGQALANKEPITNWSSLSSSKLTTDIKVYSRDATSGTRECFTEKIGIKDAKGDGKDSDGYSYIVEGYSTAASNGNMLSDIASDANGIGYASLDSLQSATGVKGLSVNGIEPTTANVLSGDYELQRYFNVVAKATFPAVASLFNN